MMLSIHDGFRRTSGILLGEASLGASSRERTGRLFADLARTLHHHHHAEEVLLFPRLAAAGADAAKLSNDHRRLVEAMEAIELVTRSVMSDESDLRSALAEFDFLLQEHLDAEEAVAIPYLLENPWF